MIAVDPSQSLAESQMSNRPIPVATDVEIDVRALFASLWRALPFLIIFLIVFAVGTFFLLSKVTPRYTAEATLLIQSGESGLTRDTTDPNATTNILDQQAILSQVQLLKSRDLARTVSTKLRLGSLPEFDPALGKPSIVTELLARFGLIKDPSEASAEERVLKTYYKRLNVNAVENSRVITVDFTSFDPTLAADAANAIAQQYLVLQSAAKRATTADASKWLKAEIDDLQIKVQAAEAKVQKFRSDHNLFTTGGSANAAAGSTPTTLPEQQLADLNAELSKVRAAEADAEAKAAQIRNAIKAGATANLSDVLNSALIQRLVEQQVALRAQMAQLSATLLPNHPRMKELAAQITNLDQQIAGEAKKVLASVEADATLASGRVKELETKIAQARSTTTQANDDGVLARALEREAAAQRELLDTYLRRYREALSRQNGDYLPPDARIVSRAAPPLDPSFPKVIPLTAAASAAALLLAIAFILIRELSSGRPMRTVVLGEALPMIPDARPVGGHMRWADDHSARRAMPNEPTLAPEFVDRVEESLSNIAGEVVSGKKKRVLVTLAEGSDADGRPLAAVSLARAIARTEARVVLVDLQGDGADGATMSAETDLFGFTDLFSGEASFAQAIFRDRSSRVHFIPSGRKPFLPEEIDPQRLDTILSALDHTYDYVVLDASNQMINMLGPSVDVSVVVSEFGAADPRTARAFDRVTAVSSANILLLVVDPVPTAMARKEEAAAEKASAGEAA